MLDISERTGRGRCDLSRKTGNNGGFACSTDSRQQENWRSLRVHLLYRNQRIKDPALWAPRGTLWPPVRLLSQHLNNAERYRLFTRQHIPRNPIGLPTDPARNWLRPRYRERTRPSAPHRSTLDDWATSNKFCAVYFVPACTFAIRTGKFPFFWVVEIGPQRNSGFCYT